MVSSSSSGPTVPLSVIDDGDIRVIFKIYFLAVIVAIAFFGGYCITFNIRRQLMKGKAVPLTATTGWIHGPLLVKIGYQLRRLPGGWLGILMLLTTALELISDIGVAKSVTLVTQQVRKFQDYAMIVGGLEAGYYSRYPDVAFASFTWATAAQDYSFNNQNLTGLGNTQPYGIYRVLNYFDYYYLPTEEDFLGYWSCPRQTQSSIVYNYTMRGNATELSDGTVLFDLVDRGLMYNPTGAALTNTNVSVNDNGTFVGPSFHLVIWTASNYTLGSAPNFTFAIETAALDANGSKQMDVFQCSLYSTQTDNVVDDILRAIDVRTTIGLWLNKLSGAVYPGYASSESYDTATLAVTLEYYLNAMIMVAGSGQQTALSNTRHLTYGAFEYATVIPYWIIAVAVVAFSLMLFMIGYLVFLLLSNKRLKRAYEKQGSHGVDAKEIFDHTPVGLLGWMSQAAATSRDAELPKEGHLRKWILSTTWHGGKRLGVVKEEEHGLMDGDADHSEHTYVGQESQEVKPHV